MVLIQKSIEWFKKIVAKMFFSEIKKEIKRKVKGKAAQAYSTRTSH